MSHAFPEADWRLLSRLKPRALDRMCWRILQGVQEHVAAARPGEAHRAYLDLYRYLQEQDKIVARCFDDWRRSRALLLLLNWRAEGLITDEEFAAFSPETRQAVEALQQEL